MAKSKISAEIVVAMILGGHEEGGEYGCGTRFCDADFQYRQGGDEALASWADQQVLNAQNSSAEMEANPFLPTLRAAIEAAVERAKKVQA